MERRLGAFVFVDEIFFRNRQERERERERQREREGR
jgi:hypothetical protein